MPETKRPEVPLNPWRARSQAFEQSNRGVWTLLEKAQQAQMDPAETLEQLLVDLESLRSEIDHEMRVAGAMANKPMGSQAEHLARKCVATWRAAHAAWTRA